MQRESQSTSQDDIDPDRMTYEVCCAITLYELYIDFFFSFELFSNNHKCVFIFRNCSI